MTRPLRPGLYEDLLTAALEAEIAARTEEGWRADVRWADATARPEHLARHVYGLLRRALEAVPGEGARQVTDQITLVNRLVEILFEYGAVHDDRVAGAARLLLEVLEHRGLAGTPSPLPRPTLSLRRTGLLVNGRRDVQIASEIAREIPSADRIDLLCAFVRHSGLRLFRSELETRVQEGAQVRVIASVYTGSTERRALDALVALGAQVKVSYEIARTRLHAKAWLFHRASGLDTAYIGSSNLTHTAQIEGLEWNVRVSAVQNPEVIERFKATFEQYWQEPEFEDYTPERDARRLDHALSRQSHGGRPDDTALSLLVDVWPKPHQAVALEALESERLRGHRRNLVVAATGTGKTWIAAFDFKRLRDQGMGQSLLFVAHRDEILRQSQQVFQLVLGEPGFGERLIRGERPQSGRYVFASVQSLVNRVDDIEPDGFDVVIVDEFHHAAAASYERLLSRLKPKVLLGLTATPERADGQSVLDWFDGRIASESRLWDALDQGLLCPFHYFGVNDATDLSTVRFERGRYVPNDLDNVLTGDHARALRIRDAVTEYVTDPRQMRALGFCAGVDHAHFMAREFTRFGYPAVALDGSTPTENRRAALTRLRRGEIRAVFAVDLFNEGVDLPEVDTVLMLRPTESATVFLQQLGRGLRWTAGKRVLTVLDLVGQVRREYRYDIRYRALLGGTRHQIRRAVEADFPLLPPGCALKLDRIAKDTVLHNLREAVQNSRARLADDLRALGPETRLGDFMRKAGVELEEIYAQPRTGHCFTELHQRAGFVQNTALLGTGDPLLRAIGRLLHVDDRERLGAWRAILEGDGPKPISGLRGRDYRLGLMLFAILGVGSKSNTGVDGFLDRVREFAALRREVIDLIDILADRIRTVSQFLDVASDVPLASHATYTLGEIVAAYARTTKSGKLVVPQGGVLWDEMTQTDLLFVTLEKSDADYSPTTRYADYPISPTLFHWESQNSASPDTPAGRRYVEQPTRGTNVILFVRERKKDGRGETLPYHCLGLARYRRHESERPMKILWELERPMPGWLYQAGKVVAG
ncbi:MAG: DUF3427 domain-containing protein [Deltaproteobacteria bacterium]|nr:DUF3427 domain-containing protein [Deltaproteobacteria bacterium]